MTTDDVTREELLGELLARLQGAKQEGHVVVPVVDSLVENENLQIRFARVPLPGMGEEAARSYVPVFTSAEDLLASGMSAATECVQPSPEDLLAVLGPDEWIAINPGQQMAGFKMDAFLRLWAELPADAEDDRPS